MNKAPLERTIVKKTLEMLRKRGAYSIKVHGSPMQMAGVPDIMCCYRGRFIGFEVKRDAAGKPTPLQTYNLEKIRKAGGIALLIYTTEQAEAVLNRIDERLEARRSQS